jgi:hypothetical protein
VSEPRCERCKFLELAKGWTLGNCHRYPPQWVVEHRGYNGPEYITAEMRYASVSPADYCGEYEQKDGEK